MAQNKTFVPEMLDSNNLEMNNFYRRLNQGGGQSPAKGTNGTVIIEGKTEYNPQNNTLSNILTGISTPKPYERPILGFLYSISNGGNTEFWPLYQGKNIIGSDPRTCNVCLMEASVSSLHATLVIQQQRNPEKVVASLRDEGSEIGTLRNGVNVSFTNVECFNGDLLTFGNNYELLFILIDKKDIKLSPSENFIPKQSEPINHIPNSFENNDQEDDGGTVGFE